LRELRRERGVEITNWRKDVMLFQPWHKKKKKRKTQGTLLGKGGKESERGKEKTKTLAR